MNHRLLLILAAGLLPATALADEPENYLPADTVEIDAPIEGSLEASDDTLPSGEFVDWYSFDTTAGVSLSIRLESDAFDTYIMVRGSGLARDNDDAGDGSGTLNSFLQIIAPADGTMRVGVTSYSPGESGAYVLTITSSAAGDTIASAGPGAGTGALTPDDATDARGAYLDRILIELDAGDSLSAEVHSSDFDTILELTDGTSMLARNDDAPGMGLNSAIRYTATEDGVVDLQ